MDIVVEEAVLPLSAVAQTRVGSSSSAAASVPVTAIVPLERVY
jgi:hypothetical protein